MLPRRGEPRHVRILPRAGRHLEAADRAHGFNIVAVEADWPDAATVDRYVRHRPPREGEERAFERFPTWMWRNSEVDGFIRWLRRAQSAAAPMSRWAASTASTSTI